jgi:hypothetical protein
MRCIRVKAGARDGLSGIAGRLGESGLRESHPLEVQGLPRRRVVKALCVVTRRRKKKGDEFRLDAGSFSLIHRRVCGRAATESRLANAPG